MRRVGSVLSRLAFVLLLVGPSLAQAAEKENGKRKALDPEGVARLEARTGGKARVSVSQATGTARFVRLEAGFRGDLMAGSSGSPRQKARAFFHDYAGMLGLRDVDGDVSLVGERADKLGNRHLTFEQFYRGVPVFAGRLRAHVSSDGRLVAVNGNVVPAISVDPNPTRSASDAAAMAIALVSGENDGREVYARSAILTVYRTGLARGVEGESYLTWQLEVGNGSNIREFLFVDAHSGKVVDRLPGIMDALNRRAYDGMGANPGPNYPQNPFWVETDPPPPTGNVEADNMILASGETYHFFDDAFGRDSFDGNGAIMDAIFNRGGPNQCPNASWNGTFISFCPGLTTDDVTGHEWGHAYTEFTHNLIYAWQPGALNESYSDIWGETIDMINNRMTDTPNTLRTDLCSSFQILPPITRVNAPSPPAPADYPSGTSAFSPTITDPGTTGDLVRPNDGVVDPVTGNTATDGCGAPPTFLQGPNSWVNFSDVAGKIVLVDRGVCGFQVKAFNAQQNGAIGVIIANVATSGGPTVPPNMGPTAGVPAITIPTASMNLANGNTLRTAVGGPFTVNVTLKESPPPPAGTDNSVRWLLGEDDTALGLTGPLRDMWTPTCTGNPGKVSDTAYGCSAGDNGGVHDNSGVPNHAYALIVDGGTYNFQTITGIGLTKAAHIYFTAMTEYQVETSDFVDHADAIEASAQDLIDFFLNNPGESLPDLVTGAPSGQVVTAADLLEIQKAMLAVEMRTLPTQCNFQPILAKNPPDRCTGLTQAAIFSDDFETGSDGWSVSHDGVTKKDFTDRDWELDSSLPGDFPEDDPRPGTAIFALDPEFGTCAPGGDESGVLHLDSPTITLPGNAANPRLTFDHYVSTEAGFDGGNLKIRVNGGAYTLVAFADYTYNPYNVILTTVAGGNTNPLAGQTGFSGTDGGQVYGSWGRSHVNLSNYAGPNDKISLRWDFGTDGCGGIEGWYVDDVTVYACLPALSISDVSLTEGDSGKTTAAFQVTLSPASASDVTVQYKTADGTATSAGNNADYVASGVKTLTIPAGQTSGTINVDVKGDTAVEADETFFVNLSNATNATIVGGQGQGTIENDD